MAKVIGEGFNVTHVSYTKEELLELAGVTADHILHAVNFGGTVDVWFTDEIHKAVQGDVKENA